MSQEQPNRDNKNPRFGNRPPSDDPNQAPGKGPRFSIYWLYAIIFAVLIGFHLFGTFSPNMKEISQDRFNEILRQGDVKKYTVIGNRNKVRVTLTESSLPAYERELKTDPGKITGKISKEGPHMFFTIVSGDSFQDDMRKFYTDYPSVKNVGTAGSERDWFGGVLQFLLPILLFVGLWILLN